MKLCLVTRWPDLVLSEDREVPDQPGEAAGQEGEAEVVVHHHPPGLQRAGEGEDAAGDQQEQDGDGQPQHGDVVDGHSEVQIIPVDTVGVIWPGPVGVRVAPPTAGTIAVLRNYTT